MYCQVISTDEGLMATTYDVQEVVMFDKGRKKKIFTVSFQREECHIVCSCHLFEFRGILCRHAISILVRNDVTMLPEMYILRKWRKDVRKAHSRVAVNYDGWVSTPKQKRYDEMRKEFDKVADLTANSESRTQKVMEWIEFQLNDLSKIGTSCGSNLSFQQSVEVASGSGVQKNSGSVNIQDPNCARRKGAPRKNRIKGALERTSKKSKVVSKTTKRTNLSQTASQEGPVIIQPSQQSHYTMITPLTFSQQLMGVESTNWSNAYGMSLTPTTGMSLRPTTGMSQHLVPNFLPLQRPMTGEAIGLVDESNSEQNVT
ncbi:protein FAR1-RELATED SEQUENCE 2-like [Diospyros lotus]|uniref:protein FAR1-RELATED SEQUENCE 2-like n=1 Tax=Diospyros lotus TaxID=55363 RepID=UPI00224F705C|nr:protein FAR1-RELATED SEQUENCE 2-like [Diospyros lotus]